MSAIDPKPPLRALESGRTECSLTGRSSNSSELAPSSNRHDAKRKSTLLETGRFHRGDVFHRRLILHVCARSTFLLHSQEWSSMRPTQNPCVFAALRVTLQLVRGFGEKLTAAPSELEVQKCSMLAAHGRTLWSTSRLSLFDGFESIERARGS